MAPLLSPVPLALKMQTEIGSTQLVRKQLRSVDVALRKIVRFATERTIGADLNLLSEPSLTLTSV